METSLPTPITEPPKTSRPLQCIEPTSLTNETLLRVNTKHVKRRTYNMKLPNKIPFYLIHLR